MAWFGWFGGLPLKFYRLRLAVLPGNQRVPAFLQLVKPGSSSHCLTSGQTNVLEVERKNAFLSFPLEGNSSTKSRPPPGDAINWEGSREKSHCRTRLLGLRMPPPWASYCVLMPSSVKFSQQYQSHRIFIGLFVKVIRTVPDTL